MNLITVIPLIIMTPSFLAFTYLAIREYMKS